ncbi:uncharacterized protein LOC103959843 [Pyrus x bretschneideri]|uniref:uncharacterized protein LOC103959843 n=1 Tax=Pyrus x bretschneideri TaxID=225117 RepID=UPI0005116B24|nr:uncharacterized protein LOC103959843 [Pyrus x bretschneideri]
MLSRRLVSFLNRSSSAPHFSSLAAKTVDERKSSSFRRRAVSFILITTTGGVALSALNDLVIYQSCSSKAMEKASKNPAIIEAIGEPIAKGPWYNASLAVAHKRHSVACTFPVSGPRGVGVLEVKAVRKGDNTWLSYLIPRDWDILIMDALVHIPENEEKQRTVRIGISDSAPGPACTACTGCPTQVSASPKN